MLEREITFTQEEKVGIAEAAREVARQGEDTLWVVIHAKYQLLKLAISVGESEYDGINIEGVVYTSQDLRHEFDVMDEVTNQARLILQFEGRDSMSELDRRAQEAGWGSVYDPESRIYKVINGDRRY